MTERDLNELDKRINAIVSAHRKQGSKAPSQMSAPQGDARSQYSSAKRSVARSSTHSGQMIDCDQQIVTANQGKVIGMTSAEWNQQVQKNYSKWVHEEKEK